MKRGTEGTGSSTSYHAVSAGCTGCCVQRGISDTGRIEEKWGAENFENYYKKLREVLDETETQVLFIRILMPGFRIINPVTERQEAEKK